MKTPIIVTAALAALIVAHDMKPGGNSGPLCSGHPAAAGCHPEPHPERDSHTPAPAASPAASAEGNVSHNVAVNVPPGAIGFTGEAPEAQA